MKIQGVRAMVAIRLLIGCAVLIGATHPAIADEVLYDSSGFVQGQQSFEESFAVTGPGTLTVTLSNINWPVSLANLNLLVSTSQGLLGPEMGAGTATFNMSHGGTIFTQWFGTAQGALDAGVYGIKVNWAPTAVPLPASIALLVSGLILLGWMRRERGDTSDRALAAGAK
jgi:hypothetical protein